MTAEERERGRNRGIKREQKFSDRLLPTAFSYSSFGVLLHSPVYRYRSQTRMNPKRFFLIFFLSLHLIGIHARKVKERFEPIPPGFVLKVVTSVVEYIDIEWFIDVTTRWQLFHCLSTIVFI